VTVEIKEDAGARRIKDRGRGGGGGDILDESIVMPRPPQSILQERWTMRAESEPEWRS